MFLHDCVSLNFLTLQKHIFCLVPHLIFLISVTTQDIPRNVMTQLNEHAVKIFEIK